MVNLLLVASTRRDQCHGLDSNFFPQNSSKLVERAGERQGRTNEKRRTNSVCSVVHGLNDVKDQARQGEARQGKQGTDGQVCWLAGWLAARTYALGYSSHSLTPSPSRSPTKNVFNEPFAAQRLEPPRTKEWGGAPSLCLQKFAINHPIPRALHLLPSIPSLALRSITAFLPLPPYFPTANTTSLSL